MSFQFIYTGSRLPTATSTGTMLARSQAIPTVLATQLTELSKQLINTNAPADVPRYSYRLLNCASATFHVLTCVQATPEEQKEVPGLTVHHLALTLDEASALRRNASRPTPAGIIMALNALGLWRSQWQADNIYIEEEPRLTAAALPDASSQATWKSLTGHKNNARAFFLPPYDKDCTIVMPPGSKVQDMLMLCHESDWLSSTRGWGKTFSTCDAEDGIPYILNRVFTEPDSQVYRNVQAAGTPLLVINDSLTLAPENGEDSEGSPSADVNSAQRYSSLVPAVERNTPGVPPYKYAETPDEDVFNILPKPHKWVRLAYCLAGVGVIWCVSSFASGLFVDDAAELTGNIITHINTREDIMLLSELATTTYSAETTARKLDQIEAHLNSMPGSSSTDKKDSILQECISLLRSAGADSRGHAANLSRLAECSAALGLPALNLCNLYLHEATHATPHEEWAANLTADELAAWKELFLKHADLRELLTREDFIPYLISLIETPAIPAPETPPAVTEPTPPADEQTKQDAPTESQEAPEAIPAQQPPPEPPAPQQKPEVAENTQPVIICTGGELPTSLQHLFGQQEVVLFSGHYKLGTLGTSSNTGLQQNIQLGQNGTSLHITPAGKDSWRIQIKQGESVKTDIPELSVSIKDNKLQTISYQKSAVAVSLCVPDNSGVLHTHLLISDWEIPIGQVKNKVPAPANLKQLKVIPEFLNYERNGATALAGRISLKKGRDFSRLNAAVPVNLPKDFKIRLPRLIGDNKPEIAEADDKVLKSCQWRVWRTEAEQTDVEEWDCRLKRYYDFATTVHQYLDKAANSYCCGETKGDDNFYSLATLYGIAAERNSGLKQQELNEMLETYIAIMRHPRFSEIVRLILANTPSLLIMPDDLNSTSAHYAKVTQRIKNQFRNPAKRRVIREEISEVLTRTVMEAYQKEYNRQVNTFLPPIKLRLKGVTLSQEGGLIWNFIPQPAK